MLIEWLYELKDSIDKHGIRFGLLFALYAIYRKERRNFRLDQRDADVFHNQQVIMEKLGVGEQWRGQVTPFQNEEVKSLKKLLQSSQGALNRVNQQRRQTKMKMYLQKLGRTKFQAFLITTILNIGTLVAMWTGNINIEGDLKTWMPGISLIIQALAGYIYSWAQGKVDEVTAQNGGTVSEPTQLTNTIGDTK